MSIITAVRQFFDTEIKKVKPNLSAYKRDIFGNNPINQSEARNTYNLIITNFQFIEDGNFKYRVYECILDLYSVGGSFNTIDDYDALIDDAEQIQDNLINEKAIGTDCIRRVEALDYEAIEEEDTDYVFKIRLPFNVYVGI